MNKLWLLMTCVLVAVAVCQAQEITIKEMGPTPCVTIEETGSYAKMAACVQLFIGELVKQHVPMVGPLIGIYLNGPNLGGAIPAETDQRWRVAMEVPATIALSAPLKRDTIPAATVVCAQHRGPYAECGHTYAALIAFAKNNGYRPKGTSIERYLNDPRSVAPADILTEIALPVEK
jgi:AraC family transcriptional regulator